MVLLVNCKFCDFDFIFDEFFTNGNTDLLLVLGGAQVKNLVTLLTIRDLPLLLDFEFVVVLDGNPRLIGNYVSIHRCKVAA